jgi:hypothetical protein
VNSAIEFTIADFPGYAEAVARENEIRGAACLGINETICGLDVKPLCAAHVRLLSLVNSPFLGKYPVATLCQKPGILNDIMLFLWIVSPMYEAGARVRKHRWQRKTARDRFTEAFAPLLKQKLDKVVTEILEYVEEAYIDAEDSGENSKSFYAFEISIAHELHEHYGFRVDFWNNPPAHQNPLLVPLKIVFQLRKLRAQIAGGKDAIVTNRSDKLVELGLEQMGKRSEPVKPEGK